MRVGHAQVPPLRLPPSGLTTPQILKLKKFEDEQMEEKITFSVDTTPRPFPLPPQTTVYRRNQRRRRRRPQRAFRANPRDSSPPSYQTTIRSPSPANPYDYEPRDYQDPEC